MKVICISTPKDGKGNEANLKEGETYTVVETLQDDVDPNVFWHHLTVDHVFAYNTKYFIPLSSIDETEFIREYNTQTV